MTSRSWIVRSVVVFVLVAAATIVAGVAAPPSGTVEASNQPRQVATSPTTGVTYTLMHSCMTQWPSGTASQPQQDAIAQLQVFRDGELVIEINDSVSSRSTDERLSFQRQLSVLDGDQDNIEYRLRDAFSGPGLPDFGPVFLTLVPEPCPDYSPNERGSFVPIPPQRVLDTRPDSPVNHTAGKPAAGSSLDIPASNMPDRPDDVLAVSLTVTLTQPERPLFAQVYPKDSAEPGGSSNVNTNGGDVANGAVVPVAADGSISVYTDGSTHVIVDINGYFVSAPGMATSGRLETIEPSRVFDTRPDLAVNYSGAKPGPGSTTTVDLTAEESGLPDGATAAVVNITVTRTSATGFVQTAASGALVPGASSVLNVTRVGQDVAGLTIVPVSPDGKIDVYTLGGADIIVDLFGWFTGDDAEASESGLFVPLSPERYFDSRREESLNVGSSTSDASGCCGSAALSHVSIEDDASAVFLNVTAIGRGGLGYVRVGGDNSSTFSTVNFEATGDVANAALVPFTGNFAIAQLTVDGQEFARRVALAVDISGYFTN